MTAKRQRTTAPPPPRTHRVFAEHSVRNDIAPNSRSQEGEFVFVSKDAIAANTAFAHADDRSAKNNVPMLLVVICLLIAAALVVFGAFVFVVGHLRYVTSPGWHFVAGFMVCALSSALIRVRRARKEWA